MIAISSVSVRMADFLCALQLLTSSQGCRIILNLRTLHASKHRERLPDLNINTFDLGDLELRTLPRGGATMNTVSPASAETEHFPPTPALPEWVRKRTRSVDEGGVSRRTSMTMVEHEMIMKHPGGGQSESYVDDNLGRRPGEWLSFDEEPPQSLIPGYERRKPSAGTGGWRGDFLDIRRSSQQVRRESDRAPAPPALPVPPSTMASRSPSSSPHVRTLSTPDLYPIPRLPDSKGVVQEVDRYSIRSSGETDLGDEERMPLSPSSLPPPPRRFSTSQPVWRVGKIAPRRV